MKWKRLLMISLLILGFAVLPITAEAEEDLSQVNVASQVAVEGDTVIFTVEVFGYKEGLQLLYQWHEIKNGTSTGSPIDGATDSTLTIVNVTKEQHDGNKYYCYVTDDDKFGEASKHATLTVYSKTPIPTNTASPKPTSTPVWTPSPTPTASPTVITSDPVITNTIISGPDFIAPIRASTVSAQPYTPSVTETPTWIGNAALQEHLLDAIPEEEEEFLEIDESIDITPEIFETNPPTRNELPDDFPNIPLTGDATAGYWHALAALFAVIVISLALLRRYVR